MAQTYYQNENASEEMFHGYHLIYKNYSSIIQYGQQCSHERLKIDQNFSELLSNKFSNNFYSQGLYLNIIYILTTHLDNI